MIIYLIVYDFGHDTCTTGVAFLKEEDANKYVTELNGGNNRLYVEPTEVK